jgi:hypothetical protein
MQTIIVRLNEIRGILMSMTRISYGRHVHKEIGETSGDYEHTRRWEGGCSLILGKYVMRLGGWNWLRIMFIGEVWYSNGAGAGNGMLARKC